MPPSSRMISPVATVGLSALPFRRDCPSCARTQPGRSDGALGTPEAPTSANVTARASTHARR
eukprot:8045391-Pyramimonas_sp.AAC.1